MRSRPARALRERPFEELRGAAVVAARERHPALALERGRIVAHLRQRIVEAGVRAGVVALVPEQQRGLADHPRARFAVAVRAGGRDRQLVEALGAGARRPASKRRCAARPYDRRLGFRSSMRCAARIACSRLPSSSSASLSSPNAIGSSGSRASRRSASARASAKRWSFCKTIAAQRERRAVLRRALERERRARIGVAVERGAGGGARDAHEAVAGGDPGVGVVGLVLARASAGVRRSRATRLSPGCPARHSARGSSPRALCCGSRALGIARARRRRQPCTTI